MSPEKSFPTPIGDPTPEGTNKPKQDRYARYRGEAHQFVLDHESALRNIAGDNSLQFTIGNGFFINLETGVVSLDIKDWEWKHKHGLNNDHIFWSILHEISHFRDLRENHIGMLANFEHIEKVAQQLTPQALRIIEEKLGSVPARLTKEVPFGSKKRKKPYIEVFLYKQIHRLYNSLDDMYVNMTLGRRSPAFDSQKGNNRASIHRLYRDFLFPTTEKRGEPPLPMQASDLREAPKSHQLVDYLLRKRMVPDQEILISPEVRAALDAYPNAFLKSEGFTLESFIEHFTQATDKNADPFERYQQIKQFVEPVFIDFLMQDLRDTNIPPPPPPRPKGDDEGEDGGEPGGEGEDENEDDNEDGDENDDPNAPKKPSKKPPKKPNPWDENDADNPEPIDLDFIRDYMKQLKEKKKQTAKLDDLKRMTPEERAAHLQKEHDRKVAKSNNVSPRYAEEYRKLEDLIDPYVSQLADVLEKLMQGIETKISTYLMTGFRRGKFDQDRFIKKYAHLISAEQIDAIPWDQLDTFIQREIEERLRLFPSRITIRLVLDGSGSMGTHPQMIPIVKQIGVLVMKAIADFETRINLRFKLETPLKVKSEIRMFGSPGKSKIIKHIHDDTQSGDAQFAERFSCMRDINSDYGNTCDAEPLWGINDSFTPQYVKDLEDGKAQEFIFLITDGGSNEPSQRAQQVGESRAPTSGPADTRAALHALQKKSVIARGLQILPLSEAAHPMQSEDSKTFEKIWGEQGQQIYDPSDIPEAIADLLCDYFEKLKFKIEAAGVDIDEEDEEEFL